MVKSYIYLGSPYSVVDKTLSAQEIEAIKLERFQEISSIGGELTKKGYILFCPISQSHCLVRYSGLQNTDWNYWKKFDTLFLRNSSGLFVATMHGWRESVGLQAEIKLAKKFKKPIRYVHTTTLELTKEPKQ